MSQKVSDRPLSVAFLSHLASPVSPTGAEHSLALLAEGLRRRGHRVVVVAPGAWALAGTLKEAGVELEVLRSKVCWLAYYDGVSLPRAILNWLRFTLPDPGRRKLRRFLRSWRPDVVHVNCLPHLGGARAARALAIPVVWHLREILPPGSRRRWFVARLAAMAKEIVAVSEAVAAWIGEEGLSRKVSVIHNGVGLQNSTLTSLEARRKLGLPGDGCLVGLYGQILPHKGVLEFVRAGRLALGKEPDLRFAIAGSGPEGFLRRVRGEIGSGASPERFHILPPQATSETLLKATDVISLATTTPDPLPRTVLEAMAAGRPVVAFRSGGTAEMVQDGQTGLLVEVGDVEGLAEAMVRLARRPELRSAMGRAGVSRARDYFSMDLHVDRMEDLLRRAAGR